MESPVIIENCANFAMPVNQNEDDFFSDQLNDIAQRHPEFANHLLLDDFPSLRRKRNSNGSGSSSTNQEDGGSRFRAGPSSSYRFPQSKYFTNIFPTEPQENCYDKPPEVPKSQDTRSRKPNPNLPQHLSNTVDLGQKQPPVESVRNQRSMSAPPENRSAQDPSRVENEIPQEHSDMGKSQSRQPQGAREPTPTPSKERIIPIHVEGRDEPVLPKNTHTNYANSGPPPEKVFGGERIHTGGQFQQKGPDPFASQRRRQAYEQFVPQPQAKQGGGTFTRQQTPPQQQQYYQQAPPQYQPHYQQAPPPHPHYQQAPPQYSKESTPPPSESRTNQQQRERATPPPSSNDPLDKIKCVKNDVLALMTQVENFQGTRKDREYLYLDEMLTRNLLKLDDIDTDGKDNIRSARKEAIKCIQTCISNLEAKAQGREKELKALEEQQICQLPPQDSKNQSAESTDIEKQVGLESEEVENKKSAPLTFKSEATINISGTPKSAEVSTNQDQFFQQPMETEQISSDSTMINSGETQQNSNAMEVVQDDGKQTGQAAESMQLNSSQPDTATSK